MQQPQQRQQRTHRSLTPSGDAETQDRPILLQVWRGLPYLFRGIKMRGVCDGVGFLSPFGMCKSSFFMMLGYNYQHQQNNTSEEIGLSHVLRPEQCQQITQNIELDSLQIWVQSMTRLHFFSSVEGLHGSTWDPKSVPYYAVSGAEILLKTELFFLSIRCMSPDFADRMLQLKAHYHPLFGAHTLFHLFYFHFSPLSPKPT